MTGPEMRHTGKLLEFSSFAACAYWLSAGVKAIRFSLKMQIISNTSIHM